jgi:hypothetical protein
VPTAEGDTVHLVTDLAFIGSRWAGEFDVPEFGIENYPVEVTFPDSGVNLHFAGPDANFRGGWITGGNGRLAGVLTFGERDVAIELQRTGDARFSETFTALEAAANDSSLVEELSPTADRLRKQFNADRWKTRLLLLLSPT